MRRCLDLLRKIYVRWLKPQPMVCENCGRPVESEELLCPMCAALLGSEEEAAISRRIVDDAEYRTW